MNIFTSETLEYVCETVEDTWIGYKRESLEYVASKKDFAHKNQRNKNQ